ncbi:MAG TPA: hypothetical protein VK590_16265 [Saprospiraceae bacterium]|nr:hypothetical protein [Saprospiraceae bacterium]
MKSLNIFFIALLSLVIYFNTGCKKDEIDSEKPVILIEELSQGDTVNVTIDSVHVEFHVTDNVELHEVKVVITNSNGDVLYQYSQDVDQPSFQYHSHYIPTGTVGVIPLKMKVTASDHSGNEGEQTLDFYITP